MTQNVPDESIPDAPFQAVESTFEKLLESAPDSIIISDQDGRIVLVNHMTERTFGYDRNDLIGQPIERLVPERFRSAHVRDRAHYYQQPHTRYMGEGQELFACRQDGSEFPVEISLSPIELEGRLLVTSAIRDVSERKRMEQARREVEERMQALMDNASAVMYLKDTDGRYVQVNALFERLFHVDRQDILGKTDFDIFPEHLARAFWTNDLRVLDQRAPEEFEEIAPHDDGEHTYLSLKFPLQHADGSVYLLCGISTDITERKRMEAALESHAEELTRSNAELQQFAYVASHDLQEPLRMVASYAQLLARRYRDQLDSDADEFIEYIVDGATRMQNLINDLLAYSRVGTRGKPFAAANLNEAFRQAVRNLQISIEDAGAEVTSDPLPTSLNVDVSQIVLLFQNLISNGLKFRGEADPHIHVSYREEDGRGLFGVKDNGIGMESQYADRIFLLFQRLHTKRDYPGTGIGLAICKKIVERHRGQIWVESELGKGASFYFRIPLNLTEGAEQS